VDFLTGHKGRGSEIMSYSTLRIFQYLVFVSELLENAV
jgi:hypothetical protein